MQPLGYPQYNVEFVIYARKGSPKFTTTEGLFACFDSERHEHSEKPEEFYKMIREHTAGLLLDMYNRHKIEGFVGWSKESPKKAQP